MVAQAVAAPAEDGPADSPRAAPPLAARRGRTAAPVVFALAVFVISVWVRMEGLDLVVTADEGYWIQRTIRFGAAVAAGDAAATFRTGHPGVTVMWTGLLGIGPSRLAPYLSEKYDLTDVFEEAPGYGALLSAARREMALVAAGLVALSVALCWRLLGPTPALIGGALLTFDPFVVGMTRLLHVDTLLAPLMTVSALAGLIYWTRSRHWSYLLRSAVAGGLALLTKAPAGYLPIFFGLVGVVGLVGERRLNMGALRAVIAPSVLWGVCAVVVYVLLFPALWVDPIQRLNDLADFLLRTGLEPHPSNFFLGQLLRDDPGPAYYLLALVLRASPLAISGLAGLILPSLKQERGRSARWLMVYVVLFAVLMSLAAKKLDRYMLPALMMLDLAAGVGLWRLATLAGTTASRVLARGQVDRPDVTAHARLIGQRLTVGLLAVCALGQGVLLLLAETYPIAAYNQLAGGPERAGRVIMLGWGEGLEQVTAFLNRQPDAEKLLVATNYIHVVRPRLSGTAVSINLYFENEGDAPPPTPDYIVLYVNSVQRRQIPPIARRAILAGPPVFVAGVDGLEYAWIYAVPSSEPRVTAPVPADGPSEKEDN